MTEGVQRSPSQGSHVHILLKPLEGVLKDEATPDVLADRVLTMLSDHGLVQYSPKNSLGLLSAAGRVLVCIMENPDSTIREIAVRLGITESNAGRTVSQLAESKLIARTKVKGKYCYALDSKVLKNHPDIRRFYQSLQQHFAQ